MSDTATEFGHFGKSTRRADKGCPSQRAMMRMNWSNGFNGPGVWW